MIAPRGGLPFGQISSTGASASIHLAPCSADALMPATVARRPDHSHAAYARWCSVGVILRSRYTFGITAR